ncbi:MAG: serine/threonine protein phosphatase [Clostridia bacterium]|nr:serine/threonine protein phosphatase [Clostridia bacterium]
MSLFAIGDLHLSFGGKVDKPMDIYGGPWIRHWERLKCNWEHCVKEEDTVVIPGDISWAMHLEDAMEDLSWIASLPGKKVILRGNHDLWWSSIKKLSCIDDSLYFLQNNCYEGDDFILFGTRGWICPEDRDFEEDKDLKIFRRELIRLNLSLEEALAVREKAEKEGRKKALIGAMHFPPTNEKKEKSEFTALFSKHGVSKVVYGHLHGENAYRNGPEGIFDGVHYMLCSLDKLQCVPKLILE